MFVLASASPRRHALLSEIGAHFDVAPASIDERPAPGEDASDYARRMAREKALAVARERPVAWVLAADTVVEIDGVLLGKPSDPAAARAMLARLSGRTHRVWTGLALVAPGGVVRLDEAVVTRVRFHPLSAEAIDDYVATGEPLDKAGAYAVQGAGGRFVERVEGSYSNVVGLPLEVVGPALAAHGLLG
jgi:septum formation protein